MSNTQYVNVFQGTGRSVIPREDTLFSKWNLLKGKAGNVSPSACLPFGAVACSPYSGGYSSGYGNFKPNGKLPPEKFFEGDKLIGFSHFTHSGSGAFGFYYNYLVVTPYIQDETNVRELKDFDNERAYPGYYACRLTKEDIQCEVTVSDKVALHRYTSLQDEPLKIFIDVSNDGLRQPSRKVSYRSTETKLTLKEGVVSGFVTMQGIKIYFYAVCKGKSCIWLNGKPINEKQLILEEVEDDFGVAFDVNEPTVELKIGFSLVSETNAMASALASHDFDMCRKMTGDAWRDRLNAIQLSGVSERDEEIFYSNYYHTLVKPCGWRKESFLWNEKDTFYLDFATLWDVYKTQIPFIFALYKEVGRGIVKTLLRFGKEKGQLFNALMLTSNMNVESQQACCLGCYVLYDAYTFGLIEEKEIDDLFITVRGEVEQYREQVLGGTIEKTTKLLDAALISAAFADLAKQKGRAEDEKYFTEIADCWTTVFDEKGILKSDYPYYEGNHWNYSFRFVKDVQKRIALSGGKEKLKKQLDAFFAFSDENAEQDRFEGFNNETDMETPYFYHYVDGYDRIAEIMDECISECFQDGREGLPGNNDSGGLSACYIWNFLGIYPHSGGGKFFLGVPRAEQATLKLANGNTLTIQAAGKGKQVEKVLFNGKQVEKSISVEEILQGGELIFHKA